MLILYGLYIFFQLKTHAEFFADDGDDEEEPELLLVVAIALLSVVSLLGKLKSEE